MVRQGFLRRAGHVGQERAQPRLVAAYGVQDGSRAARAELPVRAEKWRRELDYRLRKELWAYTGNRISVRFAYEWHDIAGQWWRSHRNEQWEFDPDGLMRRREASINDIPIAADDRRLV
ncbi:DUF1348 family protein [Streptomyces subrutilus]|uniref:DUF1348 family protein n=1 Tax=Streptomyces subrutilus TaxID=36818 RepID=UPI003F5411AA